MGGFKKAFKKAVSSPFKSVGLLAQGKVGESLKNATVGEVKNSLELAKAAPGVTQLQNMMTPSVETPDSSTSGAYNANDIANPDAKPEEDTDGDSGSVVKKNKAGGKKSLTVARTSGGGVNI